MTHLQISDRLASISDSASVAIADQARSLQAGGKRILNLAAGEPDFDTPDLVKMCAVEAIARGFTKYTTVDGAIELKRAIAAKFARDNGLVYLPSQITVSCGAKQAIFNAMLAVLNPGDEVIVPAPYWVSYPEMVLFAGAAPKIVRCGADARFKLTPASLEAALTPRTRMLLLNSPSNPTGAIYSHAELHALGEVLLRRPDVLVLSDDIYEYIRWDDAPFHNIASACPDLASQTLVVNGVSKSHAMTGWRIGYAAGPEPLIAAMRKIQSHSTSNPNSIAQHAAIRALELGQDAVAPMIEAFKQRHIYVQKRLAELPDVTCAPASGAFYAFPGVQRLIARVSVRDDVELAARLLDETSVATVPGSAYGMPGHLRISFAASNQELKEALDAVENFTRR